MKKSTILLVMALLCLKISVNAQQVTSPKTSTNTTKSSTSPLYTGQKVPADFWTNEIKVSRNGLLNTENLSFNKNKLIIIDFWASWCASCLAKLRLLDSLQKENPASLVVLPVNSLKSKDTQSTIDRILYGDKKPIPDFSLPSVVEDVWLTEYFPHTFVPFTVWIANGTIIGITTAKFINRGQVQQLLSAYIKNQVNGDGK